MVQAATHTNSRYYRRLFILLLFILVQSTTTFAQSKVDSLPGKLDPQKLAASIDKTADKLQDKILKKSEQVLAKMQQQEEKIYKKMLRGKDSLLAKAKLKEVKEKYSSLKNGLKQPAIVNKAKQFVPRLDSLNTSLKFLQESGVGGKVKDALAKTDVLKDKLAQAEQIKKFIKERREQLQQQLEKIGAIKQLKQINKQVYYYAAQMKEYKEILKDPKKIEKKALELLSKTKLWKDFFRKNSMLASLFRLPNPDEPLNTASLAGLQTRAQVNNLIQQQIQGAGPNGVQQFRQQIQNAQGELQSLQNRILKGGGSSSEDIMPSGFKPNSQKTKSFLKRLEFGTNLQTQKGANYFPNTTDIGLSLGYKLNDKSVIGIGASYKLGMGRGWNAIKLTSEGVGLRSYADVKLKGSFWLSGGFEMNYKTAFDNFEVLKDYSAWQRSGLIGVSKSMPVKSKLLKKTKLQLLWDFMSYEQVPRTQPIVFRINYNFK